MFISKYIYIYIIILYVVEASLVSISPCYYFHFIPSFIPVTHSPVFLEMILGLCSFHTKRWASTT
ncbi:hypothetical protein BDF14DRAFT_1055998 [Spinellus fusiger]|nr:hypothetical protein BDF14DRAFT_1055998 [Spinellus fusiger]